MEEEQEFLPRALVALEASTGIRARVVDPLFRLPSTPDAFVEIETPSGGSVRYAAEIRIVDRVQTANTVKSRGALGEEPPLLVAPYISAELASQCRRLDLPFVDTAGNAYLKAPGLLVYVVGRPRPAPALRAPTFRSLSPAGLRIVFALLTRRGLVQGSYREIAHAAGVGAPATVGETLGDLEKRGLLYSGGGIRRLIDTRRLGEEWATQYPIRLRPKLNARSFTAGAFDWWRSAEIEGKGWWGGEVAAAKLTGNLRPGRVTLYSADPGEIILAHRLRKDPGGEIEILMPFWNQLPHEVQEIARDVAHPLVVYADLLATLDPRALESAKTIREQHLDDLDPN